MLSELVGGFGIVEQQTGGLHQPCANLQARIGWILLCHGTQRCVDLQTGPGIQTSFAAFADQGMGQSEVALRILETGLRTLSNSLAIGFGGGIKILVGHCQFA
ncbi:hypothetical protein D3C87_1532070 [compost metagenome]